MKPANLKADRIDRRFARHQNGKRKVVVIVRERGSNSVPAVFSSESRAASFIRARIAKGKGELIGAISLNPAAQDGDLLRKIRALVR